MEIIDELEPEKRGVYAGGVGYFGANGEMDTCIALRTAVSRTARCTSRPAAGSSTTATPRRVQETVSWCLPRHQAIGQAMGGIVEGAKDIVHGKAWDVKVLGGELFAGVPEHFEAVRYHSLAIRRNGMPNTLTVDAETADGEIMAVSHATRPVFGVQFHPESIGSQFGKVMLANFLKRAGVK
jgi:anthranilate synthase/aminodeoxychorismate synthase-like glutamine amidotransferase